jgi:asparagine synthase (glutamine-hydrolysing)
VPVGLFLSAGIDSTSLASLASAQQSTTLKAVTLGFREFEGTDQNEVPMASTAARHLGVEHQAHWITREHFESEIEELFEAMDQPSIDGVNTYFVSRAAAAAGMKVALSGLGGDELFGGYPSFSQIPAVVDRLRFARSIPALGRQLRRMLAPWIGKVTSPKYAGAVEYATTYGGAYLLRRALFMPWELDSVLEPATVKAGLETLAIPAALDAAIRRLRQPRSRVAALELGWYMRNQLLRDADWAGMAHSLEIRVPFVDVELFSALAPSVVSDHYPTKSDVASALASPLSSLIANRPKTGFVTPLEEWAAAATGELSGERGLRSWSRCVLSKAAGSSRAGSEVSVSDSRVPSRAVSRARVPSVADAVRSSGDRDLRLGHGRRGVS